MRGTRGLFRVLTGRPVRALLVFTALMLPVPTLGRGYAHLVGALGRLAVAVAASSEVEVRFIPGGLQEAGHPARAADDPWVLGIRAEDPDSGRYVGTVLDLRRSGYIACAVFVALALTTPLVWRKKLALVGAGLPPLQLLPLLPLLSFFSGKLPVTVFDFGPLSRAIIEVAYHALVAAPAMAYAVPGLMWLLLVMLIEPACLPRWPGATTARSRQIAAARRPPAR